LGVGKGKKISQIGKFKRIVQFKLWGNPMPVVVPLSIKIIIIKDKGWQKGMPLKGKDV